MFNSKKLKLSLIAVFTATAAVANAQVPDIETTASLTLQSAFTITEGDTLDFGVIRASATYTGSETDGKGAGVQILTNGAAPREITGVAPLTPTDWEQTVTIISAGSPATFDIAGAVPDTDLIVLSEVAVSLTQTGNAADEQFDLNITYDDMRVSGGPNAGTPYSNTSPNLRTDGTGATQLTVGGSLTIDNQAGDIPVGTYDGEYAITISY